MNNNRYLQFYMPEQGKFQFGSGIKHKDRGGGGASHHLARE